MPKRSSEWTYAGGMTQWGLDVIFNPGKRHMDEEKLRMQSTREEVGDSSGGRRIDLESGRVVISRSDDEAQDSHEAAEQRDADVEAAAAADAEGIDAADRPAGVKRVAKGKSPAGGRDTAAERAAARRAAARAKSS